MWGTAVKGMTTLPVWVKELVSNIERLCIILGHTCFPPWRCSSQSISVFLLCLPSVWSSRQRVKPWNQQQSAPEISWFKTGRTNQKAVQDAILKLSCWSSCTGGISHEGDHISWEQDNKRNAGSVMGTWEMLAVCFGHVLMYVSSGRQFYMQ